MELAENLEANTSAFSYGLQTRLSEAPEIGGKLEGWKFQETALARDQIVRPPAKDESKRSAFQRTKRFLVLGMVNKVLGTSSEQHGSMRDWATPEILVFRVWKSADIWMIVSCGHTSDEASTRTQKAQMGFANLRYLWRRRDIRLSMKGRGYVRVVTSVLPHGSET